MTVADNSSKRPRQRNDCTVRAIAIACDFSYDSAYDLLKANGRRSSRGIRLRQGWLSLCAARLQSRTRLRSFSLQSPGHNDFR